MVPLIPITEFIPLYATAFQQSKSRILCVSFTLTAFKYSYNGFYDVGLTGGAVMFHRAGLENTAHTVTLVNKGARPTNVFGIDYVQWNYTVPAGSKKEGVAENPPAPVPVAGVVSVASSLSSAGKLTSSSAAATSFPSAAQTSFRSATGIDSAMLKVPTGVLTSSGNITSTASTSSSASGSSSPSTSSGASASAVTGGAEQVTGQTRQGQV